MMASGLRYAMFFWNNRRLAQNILDLVTIPTKTS
jgi:hypothetical protein